MEKEREKEGGKREARTERVLKPLSANSFLFNPPPRSRKRLCGDETKGR